MQRIITIYCLLRKLGFALALIGIGYLLGNAFPTFEVRPINEHERWLAQVDPAMNDKIMSQEFGPDLTD